VASICRRKAVQALASPRLEARQERRTERDHYQLVHAGWHKNRRKYGCLIHMDLKEGKIWIQHDGTEYGVANELVELGVPKDDIVLTYQPPYKRAYTAFAVA
jgi:hypothetical protein